MECPNCKSRIVIPPQRPLTVLCAFCGQWSIVFENEAVEAKAERKVVA